MEALYVVAFFIGLLSGIIAARYFIYKKPVNYSYLDDWADLAKGRSGWLEIEQEWLRVAQRIFNIFVEKQHGYGPMNIAISGVKGIAIRKLDKISRLWQLLGLNHASSSNVKSDESISDTLIDDADYAIIALLVYEGKWPIYNMSEAFNQEDIFHDVFLEINNMIESLPNYYQEKIRDTAIDVFGNNKGDISVESEINIHSKDVTK